MKSNKTDRARVARASAWCVAFLLAVALFLLSGSEGRAEDKPRRVLILSSYNYTFPAATQVINGIQKRLTEEGHEQFAVDAEFLDLMRGVEPGYEERAAAFLQAKYSGKPPNFVIVVGGAALEFFTKHRGIVDPQIPTIFAGVAWDTYSEVTPSLAMTGVIFDFDLEATLKLAERLQPGARRIFIIGGNSAAEDRRWQEVARRTTDGRQRGFETTYLVGLPIDGLAKAVSEIPKNSIVVMLTVYVDGDGRHFVPRDVARMVARASQAPVYAPYASYIGSGVVGGVVETFESHGIAAADMVIEIAAGKAPAMLPPRPNPDRGVRVDARALERWGLKQSNLPPNSTVLFETPNLWNEHGYLVSATVLVLLFQWLVVWALLFQRRSRRRAERSLRESEDRMRFTAAAANIGLWQFNRKTGEFWTTEHFQSMLGFATDAPLTREAFLASVAPEDYRSVAGVLRGARRGQAAVTDVRILQGDGLVRWVRIRARARADGSGNNDQISGILMDITDQKQAEADAELRRQEVAHLMRVSLLGELSGAIAHEVNQPLTAILSNAQAALHLLTQMPTDLDEIRDALKDIVQEDNRAGEVVRRLRALLKKGEAKSEAVDLNELVNLTTALLRSEFIERRIHVEVDLAAGLPRAVGDSVQLQQVLLNLLVNATDAMAAVPVINRRMEICSRSTSLGTIEISIKDNGVGIKPTDEGSLFTPFFTTKDSGLGLGLTICTTIIQKHGGTLTLANNDSGGAVAKISLPPVRMLIAAQ